MSILGQFERDLLQAARRRLPVDETGADVIRPRRRWPQGRWLGAVVTAFSVALTAAVAVVAIESLHHAGTGAGSTLPQRGPTRTGPGGVAEARVARLLAGIPQSGTRLGQRRAPVSLVLFADLESPVSGLLAQQALPAVIRGPIRAGKAKLFFRSLCTSTCNGPGHRVFDRQQRAALAAGHQGLLWNYALLMFAEQGRSGSNYVNLDYLRGIARQIPALNLPQWQHDQDLRRYGVELTSDARAAGARHVFGTPTLLVRGPRGHLHPIVGLTAKEIIRALQQADCAARRSSYKSGQPERTTSTVPRC